MGLFIPSSSSNTIVNLTIANATEAVVVATPPLPFIQGPSTVLLTFWLYATITIAANFRINLRRGGTIASTLINLPLNLFSPSGNQPPFAMSYADINNSSLSNQIYCVSVLNNTTGVWTNNDVSLTAMVL